MKPKAYIISETPDEIRFSVTKNGRGVAVHIALNTIKKQWPDIDIRKLSSVEGDHITKVILKKDSSNDRQ